MSGEATSGSFPVPLSSYSLTVTQVSSYLFLTSRKTRSSHGSKEELRAFYRKVRLHNLLLGWWSIPGLVWTTRSLMRNRKALIKLNHLSPEAPAGWLPDPSGKHDNRYWDGARWTDRVRDVGTDPTPVGA